MPTPLYRGYSSVPKDNPDTDLYDLDLIKQDILNHFMTRLGERPMRPNFGSVIWDLLFNLSDSRTEELIVADARRIVAEDPRVDLLELVTRVDLNGHSILLALKIRAKEINMDDWFEVVFR